MTSPQANPSSVSDLAGTWTLDPARTTVGFQTKAMWVLPVKGTLRATEGSATIGADGSVAGSLVIDAASIDTKNKKRDDHLRTADFFEVDKYQTITFDLSGARLTSPGQGVLQGDLTIHGVTRPVEVQGSVAPSQDGLVTLSATAEVDRSQFGLRWSKMGAGMHNRISIEAAFKKG